MVYDLMARVFYNGSHYTSRFAGYFDESGPNSVFAHDGAINNGHCVLLSSNGIASYLAGKDSQLIDIPKGYHTCAVFYCLWGGYVSDYFSEASGQLDTHTTIPNHLDQLPPVSLAPSKFEMTS